MSIAVQCAVVNLLSIVLVQHGGSIAPANKVEETLRLHSQLQAALHLHNLHRLVLAVRALIWGDIHLHTIRVLIAAYHLGTAGSTLANLVHQSNGLLAVAQLCIRLGTHQQHVGIAEHDAVHGRSPVGTLDKILADECRIDILLQRYIVAINTTRTAPHAGLVHHVVLVEHIRQAGHTDCQEQTGVGIIDIHVVVLLIERVKQGQTIGTGTIGIHQVL